MAQTPTKGSKENDVAVSAATQKSSARSPGKLVQKAAAKATPADGKKKGRKKASWEGCDDEANSPPAAGQQRGVSGASSSSTATSPSPAPTPKATTPVAAAQVGALAQAQPRPGGLLDAMRQRGTLPAAFPAQKALAPRVVPAIPRTFGGGGVSSTASTEAPSLNDSRPVSTASTGSNCSAGGAPSPGPSPAAVASPAKPRAQAPTTVPVAAQSINSLSPARPASAPVGISPAKIAAPAFDFSLSPLLPKAGQAPSPLRSRTAGQPKAATPKEAPAKPGKRSREEDVKTAMESTEPRSPAPAVAAPKAKGAKKTQPATATEKKAEAGAPPAAKQDLSSIAQSPPPKVHPKASPSPKASPKASPTAPGSAKKRKAAPPVPAFKSQPPEPEPWQLLRNMKLPEKSEDDNYEISDKGDDSEAEEPDRSQKKTPAWSINYLELIEAQADIDPDTIFGTKVPVCDLEAIFTDNDYRKYATERPKRKRGSSGEWRRDRLSRAEIGEYKKKMGHLKRWKSRAAAAA
eukprot:TRINITY_DN27400_c0_g1_i1.p1 TRINITY_DN27400_c0_g1~~TRINITY_DN27400_c0_g1_i1.p1  ORF type:complete len:551 (+),score=131.65 TRINITY_DN27400_c0_g1_i1:98-1654(+)